MRMALWHEGGLGDVIDSAHLAIALRRAHSPDYLAYYLRSPIQNDLVFCLWYDGKPVFDGTLQTDIAWEECVGKEGHKWDRFIDWKPYVPLEYETRRRLPTADEAEAAPPEHWRKQFRDKPFAPLAFDLPQVTNAAKEIERGISAEWRLLYRDMFKSPYLNALQHERTPLHELACEALDIPPASIDDLDVRLQAPIRWQIRALAARPYITIGAGSDTQRNERQPQTKEWPDGRWEQVIRLVKKEIPHLRILQLGKKGESRIRGTHPLIGKTNIPELLWLLKRSTLHLACENGTVRMARACGTDSVVVFGPTSHYLYGMEHNWNLHSEACEPCFWKSQRWMLKCPKEWDALCMVSIKTEDVADAVLRKMEKDKLNDVA